MLEPNGTTGRYQDRLISFSNAIAIIGVSRSSAYRLISEGKLPQPIKVGSRTYFSDREVQDWIAKQLATRTEGDCDD